MEPEQGQNQLLYKLRPKVASLQVDQLVPEHRPPCLRIGQRQLRHDHRRPPPAHREGHAAAHQQPHRPAKSQPHGRLGHFGRQLGRRRTAPTQVAPQPPPAYAKRRQTHRHAQQPNEQRQLSDGYRPLRASFFGRGRHNLRTEPDQHLGRLGPPERHIRKQFQPQPVGQKPQRQRIETRLE